MKRKEREHLKEDPFINFVEKVIEVFKKFKKVIFIGIGVFLAVVLVLVIIIYFKSTSVSNENELYSKAFSIKKSEILSSGEKLTKLRQLKTKKGISSVINLFIASIYFEESEFETAKHIIDESPKSRIKLINNKKILLEAEILNAMKKQKEAINLFNKLLSDKELEISKDFILLKIARIQLKSGEKGSAISNLKNLINDFPQSFYYNEAKALLDEIEVN
jgi:tetratricopeptide (TPR) repeat protein